MTRPVQWSRHALDDLKRQIAYIAADNPGAARRIADRIRDIAAALGKTPTGRPGRVTGAYEKIVTGLPYIIAYAIAAKADRETVSVLRVIHTARDWGHDKISAILHAKLDEAGTENPFSELSV